MYDVQKGVIYEEKNGDEKSKIANKGKDKKNTFISIEKKISKRFAQVIILCCVVLGVVTSVLNYFSSVGAINYRNNKRRKK